MPPNATPQAMQPSGPASVPSVPQVQRLRFSSSCLYTPSPMLIVNSLLPNGTAGCALSVLRLSPTLRVSWQGSSTICLYSAISCGTAPPR
eukprot:1111047-Amphidinium_carterae.1